MELVQQAQPKQAFEEPLDESVQAHTVYLRCALIECPKLDPEGRLTLSLHGLRVLAGTECAIGGMVESLLGALHYIRPGDIVEAQGQLIATAQVSAVTLHFSRIGNALQPTPRGHPL